MEYLSKAVAAERLGLSVRRLMELADQRGVPKYRQFDPQTRRQAATFASADIARLKAEWAPKIAPAAAIPPSKSAAVVPAAAATPSPVQNGPRPWLDIAQASQYSGLPAAAIRDLIRRGKLRALDVGVRPGGRYRVKLSDLSALEGDLFDLPWRE
jgi:hypothetical protein